MADFSKEYCYKYDSGMPWDFSIEEEASKLSRGYFIGIICEGYGFAGIEKADDECVYLLYLDFEKHTMIRVPYEELDEYYKNTCKT
jgi:hypothetical protein